jgi:hypothetical protein
MTKIFVRLSSFLHKCMHHILSPSFPPRLQSSEVSVTDTITTFPVMPLFLLYLYVCLRTYQYSLGSLSSVLRNMRYILLIKSANKISWPSVAWTHSITSQQTPLSIFGGKTYVRLLFMSFGQIKVKQRKSYDVIRAARIDVTQTPHVPLSGSVQTSHQAFIMHLPFVLFVYCYPENNLCLWLIGFWEKCTNCNVPQVCGLLWRTEYPFVNRRPIWKTLNW